MTHFDSVFRHFRHHSTFTLSVSFWGSQSRWLEDQIGCSVHRKQEENTVQSNPSRLWRQGRGCGSQCSELFCHACRFSRQRFHSFNHNIARRCTWTRPPSTLSGFGCFYLKHSQTHHFPPLWIFVIYNKIEGPSPICASHVSFEGIYSAIYPQSELLASIVSPLFISIQLIIIPKGDTVDQRHGCTVKYFCLITVEGPLKSGLCLSLSI